MRELDEVNPDPILAKLEQELLDEINELGVGPMGIWWINDSTSCKDCFISLPYCITTGCNQFTVPCFTS